MKKLIYILTVCASFIATETYAQETFIKGYGNTGYDFGRDILQDTDTGYVITGSSSSFAGADAEAFLLKIDKYGDFVWSYNYGGSATEWGEQIVVTHDSTYAIGGYTNSYGAGGFDFYLVRIAADGTPIWENYYGGADWDRAYAVKQLADSGFVMVGETYSFNGGIRSGYMVRTDKYGDLLWEIPILDENPSFFTDLSVDGDSIVVCGGIGDGGEDSFDGFVVKYNIDGTFGWEQRIGQEHNDYFNAVQSVGGFYSFGGARGYNFPDEKLNMWMYRMSDIGEFVVDTIYFTTAPEDDIVNDIAIRGDQDYAFVGQTKSFGYGTADGKYDIFMAKMNVFYTHLAAQNYGEAGDDIGYAIERTIDGGAIIVGDTKFLSTGGNNIIVIKINVIWDHPDLIEIIEIDDITNSLPTYLESSDFTVYPNPFTDQITVPSFDFGSVYAIYGLDGQLIIEDKFVSENIDLHKLQSGIYLLTIRTKDGIYKKRIVKN